MAILAVRLPPDDSLRDPYPFLGAAETIYQKETLVRILVNGVHIPDCRIGYPDCARELVTRWLLDGGRGLRACCGVFFVLVCQCG
jgi:hypothetical protein